MLSQLKRTLLPPPGPRRIPLGVARGVRMHLDFAHQTRLYLGVYELELDRHLRRILQPGIKAFDCGAQHGYDSLAIANRTGAQVAAFECDPEALEHMQLSFALNPALAPLIRPVQGFVGSGAGCVGLDDWAYGANGFVPDFVKIDIEGAEVDALRSASRILQERHPSLVIEVHGLELERESCEILARAGYQPTIVSQRRVLADHRPIGHNRWIVCG